MRLKTMILSMKVLLLGAVVTTATATATAQGTTRTTGTERTVHAGDHVTTITVDGTATTIDDQVKSVTAAPGAKVKVTAAAPQQGKRARLVITKAASSTSGQGGSGGNGQQTGENGGGQGGDQPQTGESPGGQGTGEVTPGTNPGGQGTGQDTPGGQGSVQTCSKIGTENNHNLKFTFPAGKATLCVGETITLSATDNDLPAYVTWSVSNETASIEGDVFSSICIILAHELGTFRVTATLEDNENVTAYQDFQVVE